MTNEPRNATVEASSDVVDLLYLDKQSFELVLGPLKDLMSDSLQASLVNDRLS